MRRSAQRFFAGCGTPLFHDVTLTEAGSGVRCEVTGDDLSNGFFVCLRGVDHEISRLKQP